MFDARPPHGVVAGASKGDKLGTEVQIETAAQGKHRVVAFSSGFKPARVSPAGWSPHLISTSSVAWALSALTKPPTNQARWSTASSWAFPSAGRRMDDAPLGSVAASQQLGRGWREATDMYCGKVDPLREMSLEVGEPLDEHHEPLAGPYVGHLDEPAETPT